MGKVFFTSDFHLGHANILHLGDGRPFNSLWHMASTIRDSWFSVVGDDDTVVMLGDMVMGAWDENVLFFEGLPGRKIMKPGNHDRFSAVHNNERRISHAVEVLKGMGIEVLPETPTFWDITMRDGHTVKVLLSHYPYSQDRFGRSSRFERFVPVFDATVPIPLIHGHTHSSSVLSEHPWEFHVGVDAHEFKLVDESTIVDWLESLLSVGD